jgi:hypothetical protein
LSGRRPDDGIEEAALDELFELMGVRTEGTLKGDAVYSARKERAEALF